MVVRPRSKKFQEAILGTSLVLGIPFCSISFNATLTQPGLI